MFEHHHYHVMPVDDLREHRPAVDCWCHPTQDDECPNVFIHHALDGHEMFEAGERRPS